MIKKVKIELLKPGVFIHDYNCDLRSNNLIASQAFVRDLKIIKLLGDMGIKEVYIDTVKGDDVKEAEPAQQVREKTDRGLKRIAEAQPASVRTVPLKEEFAVAKRIKKQAVSVIQNVVEMVRTGEPLETKEAYHLIEEMEESVARNRDALVLLTRIRKKDEYTLMHSISVGAYVLNFCNFYKMPFKKTMNLAIGALFHDIGKTMIPLSILNKPGKLEDGEFAIMRKHSEYSGKILKDAKDLPSEACDMGLHHHERYDGSGYPHRLKGDEIAFGSQLAAIADVYDALTSDRCYKRGIDRVEALRKLYEWCEYHFNKELTHKFIRCIGVYPIGSCVTLESGKIGVVTGSTEILTQPIVHIIYDNKKKIEVSIPDHDLSRTEDQVLGYEDSARFDLQKLGVFRDVAAELFPTA